MPTYFLNRTLNPLGEHSQPERLDASHCLIARSAVGHGTWNLRNLGDPAPVALLLGLNSVCHERRMTQIARQPKTRLSTSKFSGRVRRTKTKPMR